MDTPDIQRTRKHKYTVRVQKLQNSVTSTDMRSHRTRLLGVWRTSTKSIPSGQPCDLSESVRVKRLVAH